MGFTQKIKSLSSLLMIGISALSVLPSCSHDDDPTQTIVPESKITLDGKGGEARTMEFTPEGLKSISFKCTDFPDAATVCYNSAAEPLPSDASISDIATVIYSAPWFTLELRKSEDVLTLKAIDNISAYTYIRMTLGYGHTSMTSEIVITPGTPMEFENISYDWGNAESGIESVVATGDPVTNNKEVPISLPVRPLEDVWSTVTLSPFEAWASELTGFCHVPWYVDGKWTVNDGTSLGLWVGKPVSYHSSVDPDISVTENIEIPAHSTVRVRTEVIYQTLNMPFTAVLIQPNSKSTWPFSGNCTVRQPSGWNVRTVD